MSESHADVAYYLGIDGGATKTSFLLVDRSGLALRRLELGSSNPVDLGIEQTGAVLAEGIETVCDGIPYEAISVYAGISGGGLLGPKMKIAEMLGDYPFAYIGNGSDGDLLVSSGLGSRDGVVAILGTGSVVYVQQAGRRRQLGGFGYLFDRGGNGYSIGRDVILAALEAEDGSGPDTSLGDLLAKRFPGSPWRQLTSFYNLGKRGIAALAPLAFQAHDAGDRLATKILEENMAAIARLLEAGAEGFGDRPVDIILFGGLTARADVLIPMLETQLSEAKRYRLTVYEGEVLWGAILLAGYREEN